MSRVMLVQSKDQITAGNAVRKDQMEGKAAIANKTTSCVFKLLQDAGEISFLLIYIFSYFVKLVHLFAQRIFIQNYGDVL